MKGIRDARKRTACGAAKSGKRPRAGSHGLRSAELVRLLRAEGQPEPIIRKFNQATAATLDTPSVQERLGAVAATVAAPERRSPEYLQIFLESEIEKWAAPIKAAGVLIE